MHQNLMEFFLAITSIACRLFYLFKPFEGLLLSCKFFSPLPSELHSFIDWVKSVLFTRAISAAATKTFTFVDFNRNY